MGKRRCISMLKFVAFSLVGLVFFFMPFSIGGMYSVPIDLISRLLIKGFPAAVAVYAFALIAIGALAPLWQRHWQAGGFERVYMALKCLGLIAAVLIYWDIGPAWLLDDKLGKFLFYELVLSISLIVPISAVFLQFLTGYGLVEFLGAIFQKVMRPIWKVPGRSAIYAITSRFASIVVVYLMVSNDYKESRLTQREATIIATGFLMVEIPFMIIIARTLDIMFMFPVFFVCAMGVSLVVTAILARLWPIRRLPDAYLDAAQAKPEASTSRGLIHDAIEWAADTSAQAKPLHIGVATQLKDAFIMLSSVLPAILSIGVIFLAIVEYTPLFDYVAYVFFPLTWLLQAPEPMLMAKAVSLGITEILLPSLIVVDADVMTRFIVGVVSISGVLFFSTTIPCILASSLKLSVWRMVVIWFMRTVISLVLAVPLAYMML